jgi:hypothetical protein
MLEQILVCIIYNLSNSEKQTMSKLKQLEIKKLLKELDFIESDFTYKSEVVNEADNNFIKTVNDLLEEHPLLKEVFDKKINSKINHIFEEKEEQIKEKVETSTNEDEKIEEEEFVVIEKFVDQKVKKLYREVAKVTHPDKVDNKKLNDLYLKATTCYDNNDRPGIYAICDELDIDYEPEESDNQMISNKISSIKGKINFIESTMTWNWYHSNDEKEKEQMVLRYIKSRLDD